MLLDSRERFEKHGLDLWFSNRSKCDAQGVSGDSLGDIPEKQVLLASSEAKPDGCSTPDRPLGLIIVPSKILAALKLSTSA